MLRLAFALLFAMSLSADTLLVSTGGTFNSNTPILTTGGTTFAGPNESWSLSFNIDSNPVVSYVEPGEDFDAAVSNFSYTLAGSPVSLSVASIMFYNSAQSGLFDVCFDPDCNDLLSLLGPQVYSGSESSPTILPGTYPATEFSFPVGEGEVLEPNPTVSITATTPAVPEPATFWLLGIGVLALAAWRKRPRLVS